MKKLICLLLLLASFALPNIAQARVETEVVIGTAPPAPIEEVMPIAPGPPAEFIWHPGHWRWIDERYMWVPGHWAHRPHPQAVWVAPAYVQQPGGYMFVEGHWK
jgi:hypothetical protein